MWRFTCRDGRDELRIFAGGINFHDVFPSHADISKLAVFVVSEVHVIFCGLAGTAENSGMSPSSMVGWVKMASRNAV